MVECMATSVRRTAVTRPVGRGNHTRVTALGVPLAHGLAFAMSYEGHALYLRSLKDLRGMTVATSAGG